MAWMEENGLTFSCCSHWSIISVSFLLRLPWIRLCLVTWGDWFPLWSVDDVGLKRERTECSASGEWLVSCPKGRARQSRGGCGFAGCFGVCWSCEMVHLCLYSAGSGLPVRRVLVPGTCWLITGRKQQELFFFFSAWKVHLFASNAVAILPFTFNSSSNKNFGNPVNLLKAIW